MVFFVVVFSLTYTAISRAGVPTVFVQNSSTAVTQQQLDASLPDIQIAVSRDLASAWGTDALITDDPAQAQAAQMRVVISDIAPACDCLGKHVVIAGRPTALIYAGSAEKAHYPWSVTFTHELFEMIVDPWANRFAYLKKRFYLVEPVDPVQAARFGYYVNKTPVADFVFPAWYNGAANFDQTHTLHARGQIGAFGFATYLTATGWKQVTG